MKKIVYFYFNFGARYGFGHYTRCLVFKKINSVYIKVNNFVCKDLII